MRGRAAGLARRRLGRALDHLAGALAARDVGPGSLTLAGFLVSVTAGVVLATGGAAREPMVWFLVPSLGAVRLVLYALETRLVDCRTPFRRPEERSHGQR